MTIVRVGTTKKYSDGWEAAFGKTGSGRAAVKSKSATKSKTASTAANKRKKKVALKAAKR